jgi:hypothetical protein
VPLHQLLPLHPLLRLPWHPCLLDLLGSLSPLWHPLCQEDHWLALGDQVLLVPQVGPHSSQRHRRVLADLGILLLQSDLSAQSPQGFLMNQAFQAFQTLGHPRNLMALMHR